MMDEYENESDASNDVVDAVDRVEDAVGRVENAVGRVETAVKEGTSSSVGQWVVFVLAGFFVVWIFDSIGESRWWNGFWQGVNWDKVVVQTLPHDCNFLAAPLGEKYCHYKKIVSTVQWARSTTGNPIVSNDEGKTWTEFTPDAYVVVPKSPTIEHMNVDWQKVEE